MPTQTDQSAELENLTDEEIQQRLAGESLRGPRTFRGKPLAVLTLGLRDLVLRVLQRNDNQDFHDCVMLYILEQAHAEKPEEKLAKRQALIRATDDPDAFRAMISIGVMDELTREELVEARRVVNAILKPVNLAQVTIAAGTPKKKAAKAPPSRTNKRS